MTSRVSALILDVDGVLLASPHEQAWRDALTGLADPARFTSRLYQDRVAGRPRADGALAALEALGVPGPEDRAPDYAARKQARLESLIRTDGVQAFPDGLRFVERAAAAGLPMAVVSSSRNADAMLKACPRSDGGSLLDLFRVNLNGRGEGPGKPDPWIVLRAAAELETPPQACLVVEDAPAGVRAARAADALALGVARQDDAAALRAAGAHRVVVSLDEVEIEDLATGLWREPPA
ncbi:Beta-phosphoglucomutase [compost metagenome]